MTSIKLTYFDIEGVAEQVRLALVLSGTEFEDIRVKFPEWAEMKPTTPYGQLPMLTVDNGPTRTQSNAMLRWVSTLKPEKELYPAEKLFDIEEAIGVLEDMNKSFTPCIYLAMRPQNFGYPEDFAKTIEGKAKIEEFRKNWVANELPKHLKYISDMIEKNGGSWLVKGDKPTIADCKAASMLRNFTRGHIDHFDTKCLEINPTIVQYAKRFCDLDGVKGRYTNGIGSDAY